MFNIINFSDLIIQYRDNFKDKIYSMALDNTVISLMYKKTLSLIKDALLGEVFMIGRKDFCFPIFIKKECDKSFFKRLNLIVSMDNRNPLFCVTDKFYDKVVINSPFLQSLKKLRNYRIKNITTVSGERIITFHLQREESDEIIINEEEAYRLNLEFFGNHPNIIVESLSTNLISNIYHEKGDFLSENFVGKNCEYILPDEKKRIEQFSSLEEIKDSVSVRTFKYMEDYFAKTQDFDRLVDNLVKSNTFYVVDNTLQVFHFDRENVKKLEFSDFYDYFNKNHENEVQQLKEEGLFNLLLKLNKTIQRKLNNLEDDLKKSKNNLVFKDYGENLLNYQYEDYLIKNSTFIYDDLKIPLNNEISLKDNAMFYFKKYKKAKNSIPILENLITQTRYEKEYLKKKLIDFSNSNASEIAELKEELVFSGYLKTNKKNQKGKNKKNQQNQKKFKPKEYHSPSGLIRFGINDLQNEYLTFTIAQKNDIFLHVKDYPGAHLVISNEDFLKSSNKLLEEAGQLALYLSNIDQGEIYYTEIKNVKKNSAKLGLVNILSFKTFNSKLTKEKEEKIKESLKN